MAITRQTANRHGAAVRRTKEPRTGYGTLDANLDTSQRSNLQVPLLPRPPKRRTNDLNGAIVEGTCVAPREIPLWESVLHRTQPHSPESRRWILTAAGGR